MCLLAHPPTFPVAAAYSPRRQHRPNTPSMKPDPFTPWRAQKRKALQQNMLAGLSGLTAIALPLRLGWRSLWISALLGLLAWVLTRWARINRRHAAARHHGKTVEQRASALAQRILLGEGLMVECNRRVPGLGDVDLLVTGRDRRVTVEIKSFQHWGNRHADRRRERLAIEQCVRQRETLATDGALLWLPDATPSLWQRLWGYSFAGQGVALVRGDERRLLRALRCKLGG